MCNFVECFRKIYDNHVYLCLYLQLLMLLLGEGKELCFTTYLGSKSKLAVCQYVVLFKMLHQVGNNDMLMHL